MRGIVELVDVDEPAWPELQRMFGASSVPVQVLPGDIDEGRRCLLQMQVSARSVLGALALGTGGVLVDNGWLRVFGGGSASASEGGSRVWRRSTASPRSSIRVGIRRQVSSSATTSSEGSSR
ncbi:DUF2625 family protein [Streptomyces sp. NPDC096030]|uniref:DUF2625 family protein n=1 Tax=Streptomyces sp. NPDC096030 TaxID=3155423 RepID=UPI0033277A26